MNVNGNIGIKRKRGWTYQITYISAVVCHVQPNLVPNRCYDIVLLCI